MAKTISNQPPKGTQDWLPEEFQIRKYIFDIWRKVCQRYGYQEYLTPLVESAEVYRAKSGEDVGGKELVTFKDLGGRELSIRPEMTPSVTRMVSKIYDSTPKPIRLFSIANFMRNEKPQRGRNREFWQLNFDIFGSESIQADIEVAQMALDIMLEFKPPKDSFVFYINNRKLIDAVLDELIKVKKQQKVEVVRILDKWEKLNQDEFIKRLSDIGLNNTDINKLLIFMQSDSSEALLKNLPELSDNNGLKEVNVLLRDLSNLGYADYIYFKPNLIRGFDYYDGLVFEVFDKHPDNTRAMFGGGRYNGLAEIFGQTSFPAVGFAPGDETTRLFLESWGLIDKIKKYTKIDSYYLPLLDEKLARAAQKLAQKLRRKGRNVTLGLVEQKIGKALKFANNARFSKVVILGEEEKEKGIYKIKDMESGAEKEFSL